MQTWTRAIVGAVVAMLVATTAEASDIPEVTITDAGPDRDVPIGTAFYLKGSAETATSVSPVFVRIGTKHLFGNTGGACSAFASHVGKFQSAKGPSDVLDSSLVGATTAGKLWVGTGAEFDPDEKVFIPAAWKPQDEKDKTFKVLVPFEPFFSSAGRYCLFVYKTTTKKTDRANDIKAVLETFANAYVGCAALPDANARRSCAQNAQLTREKALAAIEVDLDEATQDKLREAANGALNTAINLRPELEKLDGLLATWARAGQAASANGFTKPLTFDEPRMVADESAKGDPLGRATLSLLAEHHAVVRTITPGKSYAFFTLDGKTQVNGLRIASNGSSIYAFAEETPKDAKGAAASLEKTTDALSFSGLDVTLRDILESTRGRIRVGKSYENVADVRTKLAPLLASRERAEKPDIDTSKALDELDLRSRMLAHVVERALHVRAAAEKDKGSAEAKAALGTETATFRELGRWLAPLLVPCSPDTLARWHVGNTCGMPDPADGVPWPGYGASGDNPFEFVHARILTYKTAVADWPAKQKALETTISEAKTQPSTPISMTVGYSQENWVFSYVTPVVGVSFFLSPTEAFSVPYVAAQIHVVANPVDEPLWTRPGDFWRSFALELGMVTGNGPWGPDNRFSGWRGLPPVLVGFAVHPLPYTSLSIGGAFLQRRSSTVADEKPSTYLSVYAGANVQINIPDLIVALKGRHSQTASQK